jgi:ATP-binding cassette subfamily B protein RaxB
LPKLNATPSIYVLQFDLNIATFLCSFDLNTLRRRHPVSLSGVTLRGLIQVADQLDLACRPLRLEPEHLRQLRLPAILHWDLNHFVVLKAVTGRGIVVHDPAAGERTFPIAEASKHLTGVALEVAPAERFARRDERARLPFAAFWGGARGLAHPLVQVFVLSAVLEALVIAAPFYVQITVDEVIARGDADLLAVLALGFGLLTLVTVATTALRSRVILVVQNFLHFRIGARLFHHLLRLPLSWFEKRHVGDVLSRFGSIEPVRNLLAEGLIAAAIDGVMAVATLAMIVAYRPLLAAVVLAALALYAALRLGLYRVLRTRSEAAIQSKAQEGSAFIETVRAVQSLKLFNKESEREGQWLNRYAEAANANANVRLGRARIGKRGKTCGGQAGWRRARTRSGRYGMGAWPVMPSLAPR